MKDQPINQPVIETKRLTLRPLMTSDAGLLTLYAGDSRVAHNISLPHPLPPGETEAFIARSNMPDRIEDVWALDGSKSGLPELLGVASLERLDREQSEISYWVAPPFWNMGVASEVVEAMVATNPQAARTIFAEVIQTNPASARVLTNAGFDYLGDAEMFLLANGAKVPSWTYMRKVE